DHRAWAAGLLGAHMAGRETDSSEPGERTFQGEKIAVTSSVNQLAGVSAVATARTPRVIRIEDVRRALQQVQGWVEQHDYRGYEPFDGLSSWARPLALGNQLAERILQQAIRQCPFNLRP